MKLENRTRASVALLRTGSPTSSRHALGCVIALFAVAHLMYLEGPLKVRLATLAAVSSIATFAAAFWLSKRSPPLSAAHALQALVGAVPLLNGSAHMLWSLQAAQTTNLAVLPRAPATTSSRAPTRSFSSTTCEMMPTSRPPA